MLGRYQLVRRPLTAAVMAMAGLLCGAGRVQAAPSADEKALATMLFQDGRALMAEGRIPEACQKLQESQRLDPGGGTLLNLALCHEQESRLAHSWSEFKEALIMARADARTDREIEAAKHVAALEPRLSRLTIVVPTAAQVDGLLIEQDGREVGRGSWSTAIPIDGGEHILRATAPGRDPFATTIVIGKESDTRTVEIPVLAIAVVAVAPSGPATPEPSRTAWFSPARLRWGGIAVAGAGVLVWGAAGYALSTAIKARDASNTDCWTDGCDSVGLQQRGVAVSRGNLATLLGVGGAVLVGAGATMFYFGHRSTASHPEAQISMQVVVDAAPGALATGIQGRF
jgi:hypothetical protein